MFISLYLTLKFFYFFLKFLVVHPDDQILKSGCPERNLVVIDDRTSVIFSSAEPQTFITGLYLPGPVCFNWKFSSWNLFP